MVKVHTIYDTNQSNQQMTKDMSSTSQNSQSSQYTKSGPTKPRESISGRRSYKPEYQEVLPSGLFHKRKVMQINWTHFRGPNSKDMLE